MSAPATARGAPAPRAAPLGLWDAIGAAIVALTLVLHLRFVLLDGRPPADPGLYLKAVPQALDAMRVGDGAALGAILVEVSGWYNLLIAAAHHLAGGALWGARLPTVCWLALTLGAIAAIARRAAGPGVAAAAVALAAAAPILTVQGRTLWIHVPEAALVLMGLACVQADPRLQRSGPRLGLALAVLLVLSLRPSGLAWVALVGLPWLHRPRPRWGLLIGLVGVAIVAVLPTISELSGYLQAKWAARDGYVARMPAPTLAGLRELLGPAVTVAVAAIVPTRAPLLRLLLAAVVALSGVLWLGFRAGLDNFTLLGPALALAAAVGLGRLRVAGPALAVCLWVGALWPGPGIAGGQGRPPLWSEARAIKELHNPWLGYGGAEVRALVRAACGDGPCQVAVNKGVFEPGGEEPGRLGLALLGLPSVTLANLRYGSTRTAAPPSLAVDWECPVGARGWAQRFPQADEAFAGLVKAQDMRALWSDAVGPGCVVRWWVHPTVDVNRPALPTTGVVELAADAVPVPAAPRRPPPRRGPLRGGGGR